MDVCSTTALHVSARTCLCKRSTCMDIVQCTLLLVPSNGPLAGQRYRVSQPAQIVFEVYIGPLAPDPELFGGHQVEADVGS